MVPDINGLKLFASCQTAQHVNTSNAFAHPFFNTIRLIGIYKIFNSVYDINKDNFLHNILAVLINTV